MGDHHFTQGVFDFDLPKLSPLNNLLRVLAVSDLISPSAALRLLDLIYAISQPLVNMHSSALVLAGLLAALASGQTCYISPAMKDDTNNANNLAYALQNVTCPVNTAYIELYSVHNVSSVLPDAAAVIDTLKTTTVWLKGCGKIDNPNDADILRGPVLGVPYNFEQYVSNLVQYRTNIENKGWSSKLIELLQQQKSEYQPFWDQVIDTIPEVQRDSYNQILGPVKSDLDCAISAFGKSGSSITACPTTSTGDIELPTTATSSGSSAATTTASGTAGGASPSTTSGAGAIVGYNMAIALGVLIAV